MGIVLWRVLSGVGLGTRLFVLFFFFHLFVLILLNFPLFLLLQHWQQHCRPVPNSQKPRTALHPHFRMRSPLQHLILPTPPIPHLNVQVPPANHVAVDFLDGGEGETAEDDWGARGETGFEGLEGGGEVVGTH